MTDLVRGSAKAVGGGAFGAGDAQVQSTTVSISASGRKRTVCEGIGQEGRNPGTLSGVTLGQKEDADAVPTEACFLASYGR